MWPGNNSLFSLDVDSILLFCLLLNLFGIGEGYECAWNRTLNKQLVLEFQFRSGRADVFFYYNGRPSYWIQHSKGR